MNLTTVPFSRFLNELLQYVPDAPDPVALNAVRNAAIEFCERTRFWQADIDDLLLIKDLGTYEIDSQAGVKFVDVQFAYQGERLLVPKAAEELNRLYRWTNWQNLTGKPVFLTRMNEREIILVPKPEVGDQKLTVRAAFAPTRDATGVGVDVYEYFLECICDGARARLYGMPSTPYYDANAATFFERKFRADISRTIVQVNRSLTRTSPQVEYQRIT